MAYPEKMTLTCGRTEYRGGEKDGITSRKVEVRVTYRLERRDVDLLHAVSVAARELDAAQDILWHEAQGGTDDGMDEGSVGQTELPLDERGNSADEGKGPTDADAPPYFPEVPACGPDEGDPAPFCGDEDMDEDIDEDMNGAAFDEDAPDDGPRAHFGHTNGSGAASSGSYACQTAGRWMHGVPPGSGDGSNDGTAGDGTGKRPVPVTKPQKLALSAACRRLGLSDAAVAEVIKERFGKESATPRYAVERLTKKEADTLLRALAEREWTTNRPEQSVPA